MANDMVITPLGVEITIIGVKMPPAREPPPGDPDADPDAEQDEEGEHAEGAEPRANGVVYCVSSLLLASSLVSPRPSLPLGARVQRQRCPNMKRTELTLPPQNATQMWGLFPGGFQTPLRPKSRQEFEEQGCVI